ncbi:hypothetical protein MSG28_009814 [Choristoneura fumiferana]|uniref:Uncharacterized protein n=1 Tax=Choristoneura fumiferana TaxID=7141 RepID=A0ACC0JCN6_CHOFU|nr:hypothetical protein MSG28_009814 [Choristoneura fumiferana]
MAAIRLGPIFVYTRKNEQASQMGVLRKDHEPRKNGVQKDKSSRTHGCVSNEEIFASSVS